ncbi:hypothetical protein KPH14_003807 [Odynerus spinipes]|uniref:Dolichol phosphate-mannose biosynthesis regulatory protein n=1 Tax=Odynerus spinipes TaxID=1348599 RepID=A0AAD9VVQ1_9HYME|nr:hypothetical protein KPH14_003807 [Odynerus spinipes]
MPSSDREKGKLILILTSIIFLYYTVWIIGSPFIDDDRLQSFFYPQHLALLIPAICGLCFIGGLVIFTLYHRDKKSKVLHKNINKLLMR